MTRKDVAFKIRIDEELRRAFVETCREQDRPAAAQVVREFMRRYVAGETEFPTSIEQPRVNASKKTSRRTGG